MNYENINTHHRKNYGANICLKCSLQNCYYTNDSFKLLKEMSLGLWKQEKAKCDIYSFIKDLFIEKIFLGLAKVMALHYTLKLLITTY